MGNICKKKSSSSNGLESEVNQVIRQNGILNFYDECLTTTSSTCGLSTVNQLFFRQNKLSFIDKLVLDTLNVIKQLFDCDREVPSSMIKLQVGLPSSFLHCLYSLFIDIGIFRYQNKATFLLLSFFMNLKFGLIGLTKDGH